jgi:pimeloyl-ACP methyl ester carboxylesterase
LACAALLPDRVRAVALLAAVAPADARGLDWEEGLGEGNREEIGEVRKGADALGEYLEGEIRKLRTVRTEADLRVALDDFLCAADRAAIDGGFGAFLLAAWQRIAEDEIWGWLDDDLALFGDWGFELGDVVAPVAVWQGHDDLLVPFGHGRWLAERLPNAEFHPLPGVGHISLVASHFGAVLDALISPVP